jgi:hypothetical protein
MTKLIIKRITLVCLLTILGYSNTYASNRPQKNPKPQHFLIVNGHIDPELNSSITLRLIQTIAGTNKQCAEVRNPLAGVSEPPGFTKIYTARPDPDGAYQIKVPLDRYLPGHCNWHTLYTGYTLTDTEYHQQDIGYSLYNFDSNFFLPTKASDFIAKHGSDKKNHTVLICTRTPVHCNRLLPTHSTTAIKLNQDELQQQVLNIRLKKNHPEEYKRHQA